MSENRWPLRDVFDPYDMDSVARAAGLTVHEGVDDEEE